MFLRTNPSQTGYNSDGCRVAGGPFMIVFSHPTDNIRAGDAEYESLVAIVRSVRMRQLGHFMMGNVFIGGQELTLSGEFGNDGLPMDFEERFQTMKTGFRFVDVGHLFTPVPPVLAVEYWRSSGWNCVGPSSNLFCQWAAREPALWSQGRIRM